MPECLLTVREDEEGLFIRIPAQIAERLGGTPSARVHLAPVEGGFLLSSTKPDPREQERNHEPAMAAANPVMRRCSGVLRRRADS